MSKEHHSAQLMEENSQPQLQGSWAEVNSNSPEYWPQAVPILHQGTHLIQADHVAAPLRTGFINSSGSLNRTAMSKSGFLFVFASTPFIMWDIPQSEIEPMPLH